MKEIETQDNTPAQDLNFYLDVLKHRWWIPTLSGLSGTCLLYVLALSQLPVYESQVRLIRDSSVEIAQPQANTSQQPAARDQGFAAEEVIRSRSILQKALDSQTMFRDRNLKYVFQNTTAAMDKQNPILAVTYKDSSPRRVQVFLDALAEAFRDNDLEARRSASKQTIKYLEASLPQARASLEAAQKQYQAFLRKNGDVQPQKLQEALSTNSLSLDRDLQNQEILLKQLTGTRDRLVSRIGAGEDQALATAALSQDTGYQKTIALLQDLYTQIAFKRKVYQERHPEVANLKKQIVATEQRLREQGDTILADRLFRGARSPAVSGVDLDTGLDSSALDPSAASPPPSALALALPNPVRSTLTSQLVDVETKIATNKAQTRAMQEARGQVLSRLNGLTDNVVQESRLNSQIERSLRVLNNLTERIEAYKLSIAQQVTPWSVLEQAEAPDAPIAPKPLNNALFGLAAGLVTGFLLAYYLELANNRLRTREEFQKLLGVPLLGVIPASGISTTLHLDSEVDAEEEAVPVGQFFANLNPFRRRVRRSGATNAYQSALEKARVRESFRRIASRLLFARPDEDLRTLCVTSCLPEDGKAICSFQTAHALSQMDKRVLLIDADMRRPFIHELAEIPNRLGLSTLLDNATMQPFQAIQVNPGGLGFDVLTAGPTPPNPVALLSSTRFIAVLEALRNEYDMILLDTPPSSTFADSQVIAAFVDALLFVVSRGTIKAQCLVDARNNFVPYTGKFVGFVISSAPDTRDPDESLDGDYYAYSADGTPAENRDLVADEE